MVAFVFLEEHSIRKVTYSLSTNYVVFQVVGGQEKKLCKSTCVVCKMKYHLRVPSVPQNNKMRDV